METKKKQKSKQTGKNKQAKTKQKDTDKLQFVICKSIVGFI